MLGTPSAEIRTFGPLRNRDDIKGKFLVAVGGGDQVLRERESCFFNEMSSPCGREKILSFTEFYRGKTTTPSYLLPPLFYDTTWRKVKWLTQGPTASQGRP